MWREVFAALILALCSVVIHAIGVIAQLPWIARTFRSSRAPGIVRGWMRFLRLVGILFTLHVLEVWVWGEFYLRQHCFPDRETAYYFSLTSYTTVGYGDVVIAHPWRLMGGLEAITGVLLFGWSTAALVTYLGRFRESLEKGVGAES